MCSCSKFGRRHNTYCIWDPLPEEPPRISATRIIGLHFAADRPSIVCAYLHSNFSGGSVIFFFISTRVTFRPFKVIQGHWFGTDRKRVCAACGFLLVRHSNLGWSYLEPFQIILHVFCAHDPNSIPPYFWGWIRSSVLGSPNSEHVP